MDLEPFRPYRVTAALIAQQERLFIAQRPPQKKFGLFWEFPGGKVDPGESLEACLFREIKEELNWEIQIQGFFRHVRSQHDDRSIDLYAFWSSIRGGRLQLREHVTCRWVGLGELRQYCFTQADRELIAHLETLPGLPAWNADGP